jgi:hypothetical protein
MTVLSRRLYAIAAYDTAGNRIEADSSLTSPVIGITSIPDGTVWAAITNSGLIRRESNGIWTAITKSNSKLPSDSVTAIAADRSGKLWVGTKDRGLACLSNGQWTSFDTLNSDIPGQYAKPFCVDSGGNLWLLARPMVKTCRYSLSYPSSNPVLYCYYSILPNGIAKFDGARWTIYNTANSGLPSNTVNTAMAGEGGRIWIGTDKGMAIFNAGNDPVHHKPLHNAAEGAKSTVSISVKKGIVTIHARPGKIYSVLLYNAAGRAVPVLQEASPANAKSTLALPRLSPGMYIARICLLSSSGQPATQQRSVVVPGK